MKKLLLTLIFGSFFFIGNSQYIENLGVYEDLHTGKYYQIYFSQTILGKHIHIYVPGEHKTYIEIPKRKIENFRSNLIKIVVEGKQLQQKIINSNYSETIYKGGKNISQYKIHWNSYNYYWGYNKIHIMYIINQDNLFIEFWRTANSAQNQFIKNKIKFKLDLEAIDNILEATNEFKIQEAENKIETIKNMTK